MRRIGALALLIAALAACGSSPAPPTVDPARALTLEPRPMPGDLAEPPIAQLPDGTFVTQPVSARIEPGVPYRYEVVTHCGFVGTSFDVDGSFWEVVGARDDGSGNPPAGIGNPSDPGVVLLVAPTEALWVSEGGIRIALRRLPPGPRAVTPCD